MIARAAAVNVRLAMFALAGLAIFSLGLKMLAERSIDFNAALAAHERSMRSSLTDMKFDLFTQDRPGLVGGFRGACLVWIAPTRPEGGNNTDFRSQFGDLGKIVYWYRGKITDARPSTSGLLHRYAARVWASVTGNVVFLPMYQIAYSDGCADEDFSRLNLAF